MLYRPGYAPKEGDRRQTAVSDQPFAADTGQVSKCINENTHNLNTNSSLGPHPVAVTGMKKKALNQTIEKYLELCVNIGEYDISLAEIEISTLHSSINTDGELFQEIKRSYKKHRGYLKTHNLHLFKPVDVRYVQVSAMADCSLGQRC